MLARTVPGYSESSQAMSNTGENLRGRIALRLFDGVPQGSPLREGTRNGTFTDMGVIGRIEVINGPSASEGIGAAGGIINYISQGADQGGHRGHRHHALLHPVRGRQRGLEDRASTSPTRATTSTADRRRRSIERGITYDGNGRRIGMNTSGSVADSDGRQPVPEGRLQLRRGDVQRLQASVSQFKIEGKGNYIQVRGRPRTRHPDAAEPDHHSGAGSISARRPSSTTSSSTTLKYSHADLFGGTFAADVYNADQAMRYLPRTASTGRIR